jgi:hypothetical protein
MKITNEDAVSIVTRLCPDDFVGGIARRVACEQILDLDAEEWVNKPVDEILAPLFIEAEKYSKTMVDGMCSINKYGANNAELKELLNSAVSKAMMYSRVIGYVSNAHEVARTYALLGK